MEVTAGVSDVEAERVTVLSAKILEPASYSTSSKALKTASKVSVIRLSEPSKLARMFSLT